MTAIVTGVKTHNGVISQGPDTVRGERDGIETKPTFSHDRQRVLFEGQYVTGPSLANDDISPDGRYFVMLQLSESATASRQINVIQNWQAEFRK